MDSSAIFERTAAGWQEIKQKSHGLTQSERLVLILVDGNARFGEILRKAPSLRPERLLLALQKLTNQGLVVERLLDSVPYAEAAEEAWPSNPTPDEVQRFLQQDKLDPVSQVMEGLADAADAVHMPLADLLPNTQFELDSAADPAPLVMPGAPALLSIAPEKEAAPVSSVPLPDIKTPTLPLSAAIEAQPALPPDWERRNKRQERRQSTERRQEQRRYQKVEPSPIPLQPSVAWHFPSFSIGVIVGAGAVLLYLWWV
ncbi:hypothetical protein [Parvibium lacunae]|uniref:Uncharacterized protein n=1 Tax=Parvibium lacunae TaxID=1888893 RepID=A0A368L0E4_9BURK|nr:hypothetical protein [Parvibium lacunae]RCS57038.1 hypothetical protein DU000_09535 [Parvibium lacunae]